MTVRGEVVDSDSLLIHIAQLSQTLKERGEARGRGPRRTWIERKEAELRDSSPLLRLDSERPDEHGSHPSDERAPVHYSIT